MEFSVEFDMQHPEIFYKYMPSSTALLVLESSRIRWSSPLLFNDISEFQRMPIFSPSLDDAFKQFPEVIAKAALGKAEFDENRLCQLSRRVLDFAKISVKAGIDPNKVLIKLQRDVSNLDKKMETLIRETLGAHNLNSARVLCVTTDCFSDVMWGNYAESHSGCVLAFRHVKELFTPLLEAKPVAYSSSQPIVGSGLDFVLYGEMRELGRRTLNAVCYTKKLDWAYEKEWRVVTWRPDEVDKNYGDYSFYPQELESVTLGARASKPTVAKVVEFLVSKYPNAILYRMSVHNGELFRTPELLR